MAPHFMPSPERPPREPPVCPTCEGAWIARVGDNIIAVGRLVKVTRRCTGCGTLSVLFLKATV